MDFALHTFADRVFLLALALSAALLLGGPRRFHRLLLLDAPGRAGRRFLLALERKLNRKGRSKATRRWRGVAALLAVLLLCGVLGAGVGIFSALSPWGVVLEVLLMALLLPMRPALEDAASVLAAAHGKDKTALYAQTAVFARRDEAVTDAHTALRVTVEYLALHLSRRVVAPAVWYMALGLPGMLAVTALGVIDRAFGSKAPAYAPFMAWIAGLDRLMQLVPARMTALLLVLASILAPGCNPGRAMKGMLAGGSLTVSPNSGVVLGAVAGALGVALGGPRRWLGWKVEDRWIEFGSARLEGQHLARMRYLYFYASCLLTLAFAAANVRQFPMLPF